MKKYLYIIAMVVVGVIGGHLVTNVNHKVEVAHAAGVLPSDLTGWMWSSNIGHVCVNSTTANCGGGGAFKVTINTSKYLVGYAFSSNIGWIKFNAGYPSGYSGGQDGTTPDSAHFDATGKLIGWIRACGGTTDSGCTASRSDGWDGWISLSGTARNGGSYSVNIDDEGIFSGKAWGGPVVGWLSFDANASLGSLVECKTDCTRTIITNTITPTCSLTVTPTTITVTDPHVVNITWSSGGIPVGGGTCTGTNFNTGGATSGSISNQAIAASTQYQLICTNATASPSLSCAPVSVNVNVDQPVTGAAPLLFVGKDYGTATVGDGKTLTIRRGKPFTLKWVIDHTKINSCVASEPSTAFDWTDVTQPAGDNKVFTTNANTPTGTYPFTLSGCKDSAPTPNSFGPQTVKVRIISSTEVEI